MKINIQYGDLPSAREAAQRIKMAVFIMEVSASMMLFCDKRLCFYSSAYQFRGQIGNHILGNIL